MTATLTQAGGIELAYETLGDPADPPLVLVAGLGAQLVSLRAGFCIQLAGRGFHVVRFDSRDVGLSTRFPDGYSIADMAGDVGALIEALGYVSAHVVGQSLGGMVAQELVLRHPERVRSLCLLFSTPNLSYFIPAGVEVLAGDGTPVRDRDGAIEDLLTKESNWRSSRRSLDPMIAAIWWPAPWGTGPCPTRCPPPSGSIRRPLDSRAKRSTTPWSGGPRSRHPDRGRACRRRRAPRLPPG